MYLIDTNVMLAASAVSEMSNLRTRAMPQEVELRELVFEWLSEFSLSSEFMVLDDVGLIDDEYQRNMQYNQQEQEFGMFVMQSKLQNGQIEFVPIETIQANGEHIAVLDPAHEPFVRDREDRKWVACAFAAQELLGCMPDLVYGAETDWYLAEAQLRAIGLGFKRLLPDDWYVARVA